MEVAELQPRGVLPEPYWDLLLASSKRHEIFRVLLNLRPVGRSNASSADSGLLFRQKRKTGTSARLSTAGAALGVTGLLRRLLLVGPWTSRAWTTHVEDCESTRAGRGADVRDAFYQFAILELGSWFCIDGRFLAGELRITQAWCDQARDWIPVSGSR